MRWISLAALIVLTACASSPDSVPSVKQQVEANWNVAVEDLQCHRALEVRVGLEPDGAVKSIDPTEPVAPNDADCRTLMESLRRAVLLSSPLQFDGEAPPSVLLRFDLDSLSKP